MTNIEILSPVGRMDMVIPAVFSGANAIYIGFGGLSARRDVQDFSHEEKKYVIDFCHQRDVKVYLALNTILFDYELEHAAEIIKQAAILGIDGIILQDMAVYSLVKRICKDMPIHGSTQMSVGSVFGAKALENLGFKRVVLSRELSYYEIKSIKDNTNLELEVFVHGAHCMSISGQCYMSSFIGARSGNRGMCAQPCRLPFSKSEKNKNEYSLSLKDLSIIKHMDKLKETGVNSLKIEGRMKRPEYVAAATTTVKAYRDNLDNKGAFKDLEMVFSRSGFSDGFFTSNIDENMYGTRGKKDVINSQKVLKKIENSYHKEPQTIKLNFSYTQKENQPISLTVSDNNALNGKTNSVTVFGEIPEKALNKPTTKELALKNLSKLGNTPFYIDDSDVTWDIDETIMVRASEINSLRRSAIEELERERLEGFSKKNNNDIKINISEKTKKQISTPKIRLRISSVHSIPKNWKIAEYIYLPVNNLYENINLVNDNIKERIIIETPRANFGDDKILVDRLLHLKENGINSLEINNIGHVEISKKLGFTMHGGFGLNIFNSLSIKEYKNLCLNDTILSIESALKNIRRLDFEIMPLGAIIHGHLPVMITRNCPGKSVTNCKTCSKSLKMYDRLSNEFLVSCKNSYKKQYSEIYNPHILFMLDKLSEVNFLDFYVLYFTDENKDSIEDVIDAYYKNNKNISYEKITRGLFFKEII